MQKCTRDDVLLAEVPDSATQTVRVRRERIGSMEAEEVLTEESSARNALMTACRRGIMSEVISMTSSVDAVTLSDALAAACENGHGDIGLHLTKKGAHATENTLEKACEQGMVKVVEAMSQYGKRFPDVSTQAMAAACDADRSGKILELLIEHGGSIEDAQVGGVSLLKHACSKGLKDVAKVLVDKGADCIDEDTDEEDERFNVYHSGDTPLNIAVREGHEDLVELFCEKRPLIVRRLADTRNAYSPLHEACANGRESIAEKLLEKGAFVDSNDSRGQTPLYLACCYADVAVGLRLARLLLEHGADPIAETYLGDTPLHAACARSSDDASASLVVELLVKRPHTKFDSDAATYHTVEDGRTPLWTASFVGHLSAVKVLYDVNSHRQIYNVFRGRSCEFTGTTPLFVAGMNGHAGVVRYMTNLEASAAPASERYCDKTLQVASVAGHTEIVNIYSDFLLIADGFSVRHLRDIFVESFLFACAARHYAIVELFSEKLGMSRLNCNERLFNMLSLEFPLCVYSQGRPASIVERPKNPDSDRTCCVPPTAALVAAFTTPARPDKAEALRMIELLYKCLSDVGIFSAPLIDRMNLEGKTPLYLASQRGELGIATALLAKGASVDCRDIVGETPLHAASLGGHLDLVKLLIGIGSADIDAENMDCETPLIFASSTGRVDVVEAIVTSGANVNKYDRRDRSALSVAALNSDVEMVTFLLQNNAKVLLDGYQQSVLFAACGRGSNEIAAKIIGALGTCKARAVSLGKYTCDSGTVLHEAVRQANVELARALIDDYGANVCEESDTGELPFEVACKVGDVECMELLLQKQLEPLAAVDYKKPSLHLACSSGSIDAVNFLLSVGSNICGKDSSGKTALHVAAAFQYLDIFKLLVESGADVRETTHACQSVLHFASGFYTGDNELRMSTKYDRYHPVNREIGLSTHGDDTSASFREGPIMRFLLGELAENRRPDVNLADNSGATPLYYAAKAGFMESVKYLLGNGANLRARSSFGQDEDLVCCGMPIHVACARGNLDVVMIMVRLDKDIVEIPSGKGLTPLACAAEYGHVAVAEFLLYEGADRDGTKECNRMQLPKSTQDVGLENANDPREKDAVVTDVDRGYDSPLIIACRRNHVHVARLLLDWGADIYFENSKGESAIFVSLDWAVGIGITEATEMASLLLSYGDVRKLAETKNADGLSAFRFAIKHDLRNVVSRMNEFVPSDSRDLELACECKRGYIAAVLIKKPGEMLLMNKSLMEAINRHLGEAAILILDQCLDDCSSSPYAKELMYTAGKNDLPEVVEALVRHGIDPTTLLTDRGRTMLHKCASLGEKNSVRTWLKYIDVNVEDEDGSTPLHLAAENGKFGVCYILSAFSGCVVDKKNREGASPLAIAARRGMSRCCHVLIRAGADIRASSLEATTKAHPATHDTSTLFDVVCRRAVDDSVRALFLEHEILTALEVVENGWNEKTPER